SLLDEWEALVAGGGTGAEPVQVQRPRALTENRRAFRVLVRNALWRRVELVARRHWTPLCELDPDVDWETAIGRYFEDHDEVLTGPDARGPALFVVDERPGSWHLLRASGAGRTGRRRLLRPVRQAAPSGASGSAGAKQVLPDGRVSRAARGRARRAPPRRPGRTPRGRRRR
ncbi:MAG TPA: DUF3516 domain-containing protein, partial [Mycobacteriales bacterium]|nr:DUF3516 domain-containing protein [Mycobacteriales bacterium]